MQHLIQDIEFNLHQRVLSLKWCLATDGRAFLWQNQPFWFHPMFVRVYCKPVLELDLPNLHLFNPSTGQGAVTAKFGFSLLGFEFPFVRTPPFSSSYGHRDEFGDYYSLRFDLSRFKVDVGSNCQRHLVKWLINGDFEADFSVEVRARFGYVDRKKALFVPVDESECLVLQIPAVASSRETARLTILDSNKLDEIVALIGSLTGVIGYEQVFLDEVTE